MARKLLAVKAPAEKTGQLPDLSSSLAGGASLAPELAACEGASGFAFGTAPGLIPQRAESVLLQGSDGARYRPPTGASHHGLGVSVGWV